MGENLFNGTTSMQINIGLKDKCISVIRNIMVSMATHNAILKNEGAPTKYSNLSSN